MAGSLGSSGVVKPDWAILLRGEFRDLRKALWFRAKFLSDHVIGRSNGINPRRVFWISPHSINFTLSPRLDDEALRGRVVSADWDPALHPIERFPTYTALRQRVREGCRWEDTVLHPRNFARSPDLPREVRRFCTMSEAEFESWARYIDELQESLQGHGWQEASRRGAPFYRNLSVAVTRDGQLVRVRSGLHRLILAKILDLPSIPAVLFCVHAHCRGGRNGVLMAMDRALNRNHRASASPGRQARKGPLPT